MSSRTVYFLAGVVVCLSAVLIIRGVARPERAETTAVSSKRHFTDDSRKRVFLLEAPSLNSFVMAVVPGGSECLVLDTVVVQGTRFCRVRARGRAVLDRSDPERHSTLRFALQHDGGTAEDDKELAAIAESDVEGWTPFVSE